MNERIFVTGIGTGIGKTLVSAILTEALGAGYWKPVQAGVAEGTDAETVRRLVSNPESFIHPETYILKLAASPHIAARQENIRISLEQIAATMPVTDGLMIIEGAGGLMVPLNDNEFVSDLINMLDARVILVSRNMLGSINHSLLTAQMCRHLNIPVIGWIFNGDYMDYENEIVGWTGIPKIAHIPYRENPDASFVKEQADVIRTTSKYWL